VIRLGEGFAEELHRQNKPMGLLDHVAPFRMYESGQHAEWLAGVRMIDEWIASWKMPIGIFSNDHLLLNTVVRRCQNIHGLNIPRDIAVLCTSTQNTGDMYPMFRISGIRTNYEQVGLQAAGLLDRLMKGAKPPTRPILVKPGEVIMRESTDVTAADDPNVAAAMHFMADECHRRIQIADVARAAAVGRRTLERRFRETVGTTIAGQLEYLRVERAKRLLAESRQPGKAIALQCGYGSALQLYRAFMRRERMTPAEYRKRIRGQDR